MNSNVLKVSLTDPLEASKGGLSVGCKSLQYLSNYDNQSSYGLYQPTTQAWKNCKEGLADEPSTRNQQQMPRVHLLPDYYYWTVETTVRCLHLKIMSFLAGQTKALPY